MQLHNAYLCIIPTDRQRQHGPHLPCVICTQSFQPNTCVSHDPVLTDKHIVPPSATTLHQCVINKQDNLHGASHVSTDARSNPITNVEFRNSTLVCEYSEPNNIQGQSRSLASLSQDFEMLNYININKVYDNYL